MITEKAIEALRLMEHVESIGAVYEPGEARNDTTLRELKEACSIAISALRAQTEANDPLTLEELREASKDKPVLVWIVCIQEDGTLCDDTGEWQMFDGYTFVNDVAMDVLPNYGTKFVAYRRKPEGAQA